MEIIFGILFALFVALIVVLALWFGLFMLGFALAAGIIGFCIMMVQQWWLRRRFTRGSGGDSTIIEVEYKDITQPSRKEDL